MKNMKRTLAMVLCIVAMVTVFAIGFADGAHVSSKVSASEVKVGETVTMTVSMTETTVSSIGVTVTAPAGFTIEKGEWLKQGTIANYDTSKNKGAFAPGSATAISGDIFRVTLKATTAGANAKEIKIVVVAKNGTETLYTETASKSVKAICASHSFGSWSVDGNNHKRTCASCGTTETKAHDWDAGKVTTPATCTKPGEKTFTCNTCKHTKTEPVAQLAHTYGAWTKLNDTQHEHKCSCGASEKANHNWDSGKITEDSTCAKEGVKTFTCADCKATKTEKVAKKDHTYTNSCDADCNKCGAKRDAGHKYETKWSTDSKNHWHKCSVCGDVKDKAAHTASGWIVDKDATELEAGKKHKECTVCKVTVATETIPAKGCKHTAGTTISGKKDATCETEGYTGDEICKTCKTVMKKGTAVDALGHDIELQNAKEATCKEDGYTGDEYCKTCKKVIKQGEVVAKGEHNVEITDAKEATCTEEGFTGKKTCKTCGEVTDEGQAIPKVEHEYVDGVCKNCNAKDPNYVAPTEPKPTEPTEPVEPDDGNGLVWVLVICGVVAVAAIGIIIFIVVKRRNDEEEE